MLKKQRVLYAVLMIFPALAVIISLFLPYLIKLNVQSGDLSLPTILYGHQYPLAIVVALLMVHAIFCISFEKKIFIAMTLNVPILFLVYIIRYSIHFQGYIDHDYDSKTGSGFIVLFITAMVQFGICGTAFIAYLRNRDSKILK